MGVRVPLTKDINSPGRLGLLLRRLARIWLSLHYQVLDRRHGRLVIESIDGLSLLVLPGVFNPVLFRSGRIMAEVIGRLDLSGMKVLDLGTGSGVGALFAAKKGAEVVAVDINPDAVRCAQINALLNNMAGDITVMEGDLFAPVSGQRFDLVLFNPPYYRGRPENYPDYAWRGEVIFERFTGQLAAHLLPGSRCLIILSTDGNGDQLLAQLGQAGFDVTPMAHKNLINEIFTVYEARQGSRYS